MSSYERSSRLPTCTECPVCRSHAAVFRAHLDGARFYCAHCRKTFNAVNRRSSSTAFSLGPAAGGGSLADTVAFVPDTQAEFDVRIEATLDEFPAVRLASFAGRRDRSRSFWRQLGFVLAMGLGLAVILLTMARATRSGPVAERPVSRQHLLR